MGIPNLPTSSPPEIPPQSSSATMKYLAVIVATVLASATAAPGWHKSSHSNTRTMPAQRTPAQKNIAELAIATPALSTLVAAVQAAGLVETLSGPGPFTVFAPTNDAFAKIPSAALNDLLADKDALTAVLLRHVVPSTIMAAGIPAGRTAVATAGGEKVDVVNDGGVTVNGATVIATDIAASNGVVHLVDTVIPATKTVTKTATKNLAQLAIDTPALSTLVAAVKAAGLVETLSGPGPFTVFAPTNDAFAKIPSSALNGLLADKTALTKVLLRHVVPSVIKAEDIPAGRTMVGTVGGEQISVVNADGVVTIAGAGTAAVIATNILASNGVVHLVDSVF